MSGTKANSGTPQKHSYTLPVSDRSCSTAKMPAATAPISAGVHAFEIIISERIHSTAEALDAAAVPLPASGWLYSCSSEEEPEESFGAALRASRNEASRLRRCSMVSSASAAGLIGGRGAPFCMRLIAAIGVLCLRSRCVSRQLREL